MGSANGRSVWSCMVDIEFPSGVNINSELNYNGKVYKAVANALESVGCHMAGDFMSAEYDQTDVYEDNDYFEESLKESAQDYNIDEDSEEFTTLEDHISDQVAGSVSYIKEFPDIMDKNGLPQVDSYYWTGINYLTKAVFLFRRLKGKSATEESLKESFDDKVTIEDGANQLLSDLFDKLGVDPQAASQFSRWDEVVEWISSVVMQLKDINSSYFTRDDVTRFGINVAKEFSRTAGKRFDLYDIYLENGLLHLEVQNNYDEEFFSADVVVDANKGSDINKYKDEALSQLYKSYRRSGNSRTEESLKESSSEDTYLITWMDNKGNVKYSKVKGEYDQDAVETFKVMKNVPSHMILGCDKVSEDNSFDKKLAQADTVEYEESLKESDEGLKNFTVEFTTGSDDVDSEDVKASSFGDLMDKFWKNHDSKGIGIVGIYDKDGTQYDLDTGEEI